MKVELVLIKNVQFTIHENVFIHSNLLIVSPGNYIWTAHPTPERTKPTHPIKSNRDINKGYLGTAYKVTFCIFNKSRITLKKPHLLLKVVDDSNNSNFLRLVTTTFFKCLF